MRRPQVVVLAVYPTSQAGTRLRGEQYLPWVREAGRATRLWSLFGERAAARWFSPRSRTDRVLALLSCLPRLVGLLLLLGRLRRDDVVWVLREALPLATTLPERWAARRARLVWDVDDAVWVDHPGLFRGATRPAWRGGETKYAALARGAEEVWAGSDELAAWCRQHSGQVWVLPTVVALPEAVQHRAARSGSGWVGSQSTAPFLARVLPALVGATPQVQVVGGRLEAPDGLPVRCTDWSREAEEQLLAAARVGLYPIDEEHPLAQGKAGLKAVLYLAHGLPCVVTPTRTVSELVRHEREGLHARTPQEWHDAVRRLHQDDELWDRLAAAARLRAHELSLQAWAPRVVARLHALGGAGLP